MSRYKCIHAFTDLQDLNHVYIPGDKFPWDDKKVNADRIIELSTNRNKLHKPLIQKIVVASKTEAPVEANVEADVAAEPKKTTKSRGRKKKETKE